MQSTMDKIMAVFDQCWIVLDAGVFKQSQYHPTMLNFSTRTHDFDQLSENVGRCWTKSLNIIKLHLTSSNTIQHVRSCCSNGPNMLRPTMFDNV